MVYDDEATPPLTANVVPTTAAWLIVVILEPNVEPILTAVVEEAAEPVPILTALVNEAPTTPVEILVVEDPVEL